MRSKFWKIVGITVGLLVILLLLFVVAFVFNPFEGSLADIRELVPGDVDYFVRKDDLKEDFRQFPEPLFWEEFARSSSWQALQNGPAYRELQRGIHPEQIVQDLRRASDELAKATGGVASLVEDVIGQDVVVAGDLRTPGLESSAFCAYLRVSWKVRFAWGLLEWNSVRSSLGQQGLVIERNEDGTMVIGASTPRPLHIARYLDCVLVSNDAELLNKSLEHARGATEADSFAATYQYRDGVEAPMRAWEDSTGLRANALQFYLRPDQLFALTRWDDGWPDAQAKDDMNQRVLASFLNLSGWTFFSGSAIFEARETITDPDSLTLLGRVELNPNMHTGFQREFFHAEPQDRAEWLTPFLTMVPDRACAAAALRMPAGDFLAEMFQAMDAEDRRNLDELVARTGTFQNVMQIIDSIRPALLQRTGFVFHKRLPIGNHPDGRPIETFEPSAAPHVAWVFWIDPRFRKSLDDFYQFMTVKATTLGFTNAYDLGVMTSGGGDAAREFVNPNIPATGEIALSLYGNFFIVSNSGPLIRDMVRARLQSRNVLGVREYQTFDRELSNKLSAFMFVQGERMSEVAQDYLDFIEGSSEAPDPGWAADRRGAVERDVLRREFPQARAVGSLQGAQRQRFEQLIGEELKRLWAADRDRVLQGSRGTYTQLQALMKTFSAAYMQLTLDPQHIDMKSRVLMQFR